MKRIALKSKLLLLLGLPLAGMIFFGARGAMEKWRIVRGCQIMEGNSAVLKQMGGLVHELQRERGRSAVFLGSKGAQFSAELSAQQQATDTQLAKLAELQKAFSAATLGTDFEARPDAPGPAQPARSIIAWDPARMSTGVESVDAQHRVLIERINELHAACLAGTARSELKKLLSFIGDSAQTHFRDEQHRCPALGQNKAAHMGFLRDFENLCATVNREDATTSAVLQIKEMFGRWLQNHICSVDTRLRHCPKPQLQSA